MLLYISFWCNNKSYICEHDHQLTTKAVEKDARRNREHHYLCGSLRDEGSTLTLLFPLPNIPFPMKNSSNEWSDKPRSKRHVSTKSNQEKSAKDLALECKEWLESPTGSALSLYTRTYIQSP